MSGELPGLTVTYFDHPTQVENAQEALLKAENEFLTTGVQLAEAYVNKELPVKPEETPAYKLAVERIRYAENRIAQLATKHLAA